MDILNFSQEEMLTFFAVLVRFSVLTAILPVIGDRFVPGPVKILFALSVTMALYPALVSRGDIQPGQALIWGASTGTIMVTLVLEVLVALVLGFTARMLFDSISFGANLAGNFMGLAAASTFDPHQETQTIVVAEIQLSLAMLVFLVLDGHHLMLQAALDSYRMVGIGQASFGQIFSDRLIHLSAEVITFGIQIAAPVAVSLFAVNIAFAVLAKSMPQLNILVLSMGISALVGMIVMFLSVAEFQAVAGNVLGRMGDWMQAMMAALSGK